MTTVDSIHQQVADQFADHITGTHRAAGAVDIDFADGRALRLWTENGIARAEFCALQGGAEVWVFAPDRDDVDDLLDTVQDTLTD
ncbi:hypothetical protein [Nocardia sp. NPDC004415]